MWRQRIVPGLRAAAAQSPVQAAPRGAISQPSTASAGVVHAMCTLPDLVAGASVHRCCCAMGPDLIAAELHAREVVALDKELTALWHAGDAPLVNWCGRHC